MIKHIKCDIFESGADAILHQTNCQGKFNSGVAKQVRERFPEVYDCYKYYCNLGHMKLGTTLPVRVDPAHGNSVKVVFNLFAQDDYGYDGKQYTNYEALRECFKDVRHFINYKTLAIPYKIGCVRGGGDWSIVYRIIEEVFGDTDFNVLICECDKG